MSKRTASTDVFDQVHDTESEAAEPSVESDAADVTETNSAVESAEPAAASKRRVGLAAVVCALLFTILVAALGFLGWRQYEQYRVNAASDAALQAAKDYAVVLTTLDAKNIDENYRKSLDGSTGEFKDAYSQGATQLRQVLIDNKASGTGIVVAAAVKSATPDKVEVLLFVDQSITNANNPSPRIDRNRIDMTMEKVGDRWLASRVEIL
ncbi:MULTISPECIES: Mce associated membrane protein [unclassified Mycobacterium]|uniref:Mce associated membrane protein n=1 Tax=unclassified Mycobacterium TaxID=2642494 RepID=UPI00055B01B1|nr:MULTISPECIES: Mce associated membrane protein [unclassified Mycobacterium]SEA27403.1 Mce-associated membrane protein [Mycobacterium sp. 283mftsu]